MYGYRSIHPRVDPSRVDPFCKAYITSGRNDPALGAERPRNPGETTAFGADSGHCGADRPGSDRPLPVKLCLNTYLTSLELEASVVVVL